MTSPPIDRVRPGSLAWEAGIRPGDVLLRINDRDPRDVIDVLFYQAEPLVELLLARPDGSQERLLIEKHPDEDLGLEWDVATWDGLRLCNNNCFFCFLKGLPKGLRRTLYLKDDDYRLSFLHGNFVTLTNLTEEDWARLEEQRLSPLHVSVHATDPELRRKMLKNPSAPDILAQLRRLGDLGIEVHAQIVVCPDVNDGTNLERSLRDLIALHPTVRTVAVVPVGASPLLEARALEKDGIRLLPPTPAYARSLIELVRPLQQEARRRFGRTIVQLSDEYYLLAGIRVPGAATYDGFPQYENGIGMVRVLLDEWARTRARLRRRARATRYRSVAIATGTLVAPVIRAMADELAAILGVRVTTVGVPNRRFGDRVNAAGLICGEDFARAVRHLDAEVVVLPRTSLDYYGERFLDGVTPGQLCQELGRPVVFASSWAEVVQGLEEGPRLPARSEVSNGAFWSWPEERLPVVAG